MYAFNVLTCKTGLKQLWLQPHHSQPLDGGVSLRMAAWYWALFYPCSLMTESNIDLKMFQINIFHYLRSRRTQQRNIVFIKVHCVLLCGERGRRKTETQVTAISTVRLYCTVEFYCSLGAAEVMCCVVLQVHGVFRSSQWICAE